MAKGQPMSNNDKAPEPTKTAADAPEKPIGRPKKADIEAKKAGNRKAVGRPRGDAAIINEYKARMLNSPKSRKVLDKIFEAALNDEHKHQAAAWKLVMDRIAPVSGFDRDAQKGAGASGINITISTTGPVNATQTEAAPVDAEWTEVNGGSDDS